MRLAFEGGARVCSAAWAPAPIVSQAFGVQTAGGSLPVWLVMRV
jgi:hypothetical protein